MSHPIIKNQSISIRYALMAVLLWSTVATAFKLALATMSAIDLLLISSATSWFALAVIVTVQRHWRKLIETLKLEGRWLLLLGLLNPWIYYLVLFEAYNRLPAQQAQAINYTWAITLSVLAAIFLKHPLKAKDGVAALLGYSGVLFIASKGSTDALINNDWFGIGLALLSTLIWACYWIFNTDRKGPAVLNLWICFSVSMPLIGLTWLLSGSTQLQSASGASLVAAVYVGLFEMSITFLLWLKAMQSAERMAPVANLIFLSPFLSLVFIYFILGEQLYWSTVVGLVLIIVGVLYQKEKRA